MNITPLSDELSSNNVFVDNEMQDALAKVTIISRFKKSGFKKRSGDSIQTLLYCLLLWPLLGKQSLSAFCGKYIGSYLTGKIGTLYDLLKRQDINWRKHACNTAKEIAVRHDLGNDKDASLVVDDTLKHRRGKYVEGASSHFDHTLRKHVMGHQVLQLVLSTDKGALPIDQHVYISEKRTQYRRKEFIDNRSSVAKDYKEGIERNKNEMFREMLHRAKKSGIKARNVLGDSWFGTKANIEEVVKLGMVAVFAMRRGKTQYRFQGKMYTAKMLYALICRRMSKTVGKRFLTYSLTVELNVEENPQKEPRWMEVKLLFSKKKKCGKNSWILLLCTDLGYSNEKIIRVYSRRWAIEVYFKETKQNLGLLAEKTADYCVHYASVNLTALRYMLLFNLMLENGGLNFAKYRKKSTEALEQITFASVLWEFFKAIINNVIDTFSELIGKNNVTDIKNAIAEHVEELLLKSLRIDEASIEEDLAAEAYLPAL
jgi:hypothetical protein